MTAKKADLSFTQKGFTYWKDATSAFKKHASSDCHKEAVKVSIVLPHSCPEFGEMLSSQHSQQKKENRQCILNIIAYLKFLARQGLALRGDDDAESNFIQLFKFTAREMILRLLSGSRRRPTSMFCILSRTSSCKLWH